MTADEVALLLLAGGRSERFGQVDKLLADLNGRPLGLYIAHQLNDLNWGARIAVTSEALGSYLSDLGYTIVPTTEEGGIGDNMAKGVKALGHAKAVLIVLADMPFVTRKHVQAMLDAASGTQSIVGSRCEGTASPPVLFGQTHLKDLALLSGDQGARHLIARTPSHATWIEAGRDELFDIDTPADLQLAADLTNTR
jgi:molybdenum cofactor cytidylyltransferase